MLAGSCVTCVRDTEAAQGDVAAANARVRCMVMRDDSNGVEEDSKQNRGKQCLQTSCCCSSEGCGVLRHDGGLAQQG